MCTTFWKATSFDRDEIKHASELEEVRFCIVISFFINCENLDKLNLPILSSSHKIGMVKCLKDGCEDCHRDGWVLGIT